MAAYETFFFASIRALTISSERVEENRQSDKKEIIKKSHSATLNAFIGSSSYSLAKSK